MKNECLYIFWFFFFFFFEKPDYEQPGALFIKLNEHQIILKGQYPQGSPIQCLIGLFY